MEKLKGVHQVTNGFLGGREINTVQFDASIISPEKMIDALVKAGTYAGRATPLED